MQILAAMTDEDTRRHELKNQLAIIDGFAVLLLVDAAADHPHRHDLERIHRAAVTALDLLAQGGWTSPPS